MPTLNWSDTLLLDFAPMDDMHREFVNLLADVENCPDSDLARHWDALISRTQALFGREDDWMKSTHFSSGSNHVLAQRHARRIGIGSERREHASQGHGGRVGPLVRQTHPVVGCCSGLAPARTVGVPRNTCLKPPATPLPSRV